jgi:hypothetical protein
MSRYSLWCTASRSARRVRLRARCGRPRSVKPAVTQDGPTYASRQADRTPRCGRNRIAAAQCRPICFRFGGLMRRRLTRITTGGLPSTPTMQEPGCRHRRSETARGKAMRGLEVEKPSGLEARGLGIIGSTPTKPHRAPTGNNHIPGVITAQNTAETVPPKVVPTRAHPRDIMTRLISPEII